MPGGAERGEPLVGLWIGLLPVAQLEEYTVRAVGLASQQRLVGDRQDAAALLAGALRDQLLDPQAEARDRVADNECQLVAPVAGELADRQTEPEAGV
jgi:hypothetical protein